MNDNNSTIIKDISLLNLTVSDVIQAMDFKKFYKVNEQEKINLDRINHPFYKKKDSIVDFLLVDKNFDNIMSMFFNVEENFNEVNRRYETIMDEVRKASDLMSYKNALLDSGGEGYQSFLAKEISDLDDLINMATAYFGIEFRVKVYSSFFNCSDSLIEDCSKNVDNFCGWNMSLMEFEFLCKFFENAFFPKKILLF